MKNCILKAVLCTAICFCTISLSAQKKMKIGDEFDTNIKVTETYQKFKKNVSGKQHVKAELVYQKEFYSKDASYIKLYFENFDLASGDYVEIRGSKTNEVLIYGEKGKIIDNNNTMISNFWSKVLFDDKVNIKLYSFGKANRHNGFEISKVAYGYSEEKMMRIVMDNENVVNSICSADNKERIACYKGTQMYEKAKAVCRLLIGGSSLCTGWLLGSEGNLMTNNHCIGSVSDAQNTDFMFNYQYENCTGSTTATTDVVASSSTFIKTNSSLDYTLLKLPVNPTNTYGYLSLSSVAPAVGDRIFIPQHPGGRRKEISVKSDRDPNPEGFSRVLTSSASATRQVTYYADTEGGSSGSPVIDFNSKLVIAIHNTGGCPNGSYGRSDSLITSIGTDMPNDGVGSGNGNPDPSCTSVVDSFPYTESFESNDGWSQVTGDDGDWTRDASGTPSRGTGPSAGSDGSFYMFLEASSNNSPGQIGSNATAILQSPCFNLTGYTSATFSFNNHMYGNNIGTLKLEASTDGATWTSIWSESGSKGNQWNDASVNLNAYTGESKVRLRFVGTTGNGWSSDIAIDNIALSTGGNIPDPACEALNFNDFSINGFATQDRAGDYSVSSDGKTLMLTNNTWKYIPLNYTVTPSTVVEFEFSSTSEGEIHGVGFEDDNNLTSSRLFKVHGTQNYGITNFDNYAGGSKTYIIPIGRSYTGNMDRLVFVNDNDRTSGNNSTFSNVKVYEEGACGSPVALRKAINAGIDILGDEDESLFDAIKIAPSPIKKGNLLRVLGVKEKLEGTSYSIINMLGQVVKKGTINESATINIDNVNSGIFILRIRNEFTAISKRFIIE